MAAYVAFILAKQSDSLSYMKEVADAIRTVAGSNFKRGESAAGITAIAFVTSLDRRATLKALEHLWRQEHRLWVLPLDSDPKPLLIDKALMTWVDKVEGR